MRNVFTKFALLALCYSNYCLPATASDIGCQEADGINNCARFTVKSVKKIGPCEINFLINRQDLKNWKRATDPSDRAFNGIAKKVEGGHSADCCKDKLDGQNNYDTSPAWSNPRAVWSEVCRRAGF